jgi:hypothetical protein
MVGCNAGVFLSSKLHGAGTSKLQCPRCHPRATLEWVSLGQGYLRRQPAPVHGEVVSRLVLQNMNEVGMVGVDLGPGGLGHRNLDLWVLCYSDL